MKKVVLHSGQMLLYESARNFKIDFNFERTFLKPLVHNPFALLYSSFTCYRSILKDTKDYLTDDLRI